MNQTTPADCPALRLLADLRAGRFTLTLKAAAPLAVAPGSRLAAAQLEAIRAHKEALLALLRAEADARVEAAATARREAALAQFQPDWTAGPVQLCEVELVTFADRTVAMPVGEWDRFLRDVQLHNQVLHKPRRRRGRRR